jgi:hypothetical protein
MNPSKHKSEWNALRLIMKVTEINYAVFIDYILYNMEVHPVTKDEYNNYYYNPN